ncbi:YcxB family protein [Spirosoma endbachense]|uniref:YcxB family protein n=1 Tax=Spirosoma endbachense TaxID=2666025 RepID=A0A6P1VRH1_9BACT|nr:YcxB family protein [Spirosoma endbachense]QHV95224.1 YcxB family protein [Spirosoma endbachense]
MIVKTKKYALDQKTYINIALRQWVRDNWKWAFVPLGLILLNVVLSLTGVYPNYWIYIVIVLLTILYVLFWAVQITGIAQMEQSKALFQKYIYEIDSRQILMRINVKEGGILKWDQISSVAKDKDAYILFLNNAEALKNVKASWIARTVTKGLSKAQFIYLPYSIFNSDHDLKFTDTVMRRKGLLPDTAVAEPVK